MADSPDHLGVGVPQAADVVTTPGAHGSRVGYARIKLVVGVTGVAVDVSTKDPLPVGGDVLMEILTQLKIANLHLAEISDATFSAEDVS